MPSISEDRDAIRDLLARYVETVDSGPEPAAWADFYTDDGEFHTQGQDPVVGREALLAFGATLPPGGVRHMFSDHIIDVDGDRATSTVTVALIVKGQFLGTGRARDELRRVDGAWRIARRTYTADS